MTPASAKGERESEVVGVFCLRRSQLRDGTLRQAGIDSVRQIAFPAGCSPLPLTYLVRYNHSIGGPSSPKENRPVKDNIGDNMKMTALT
jgi:hypothetical protein